MLADRDPTDETTAMIPDVLLPAQGRERRAKIPEVRLVLAIVEQAFDEYRKNRGTRERHAMSLREQAESWMREKPSDHVFCFANVCEVLGLDVEAVRAVVLR